MSAITSRISPTKPSPATYSDYLKILLGDTSFAEMKGNHPKYDKVEATLNTLNTTLNTLGFSLDELGMQRKVDDYDIADNESNAE